MFSPLEGLSEDEIFNLLAGNSELGDHDKNAALFADYAMMNKGSEGSSSGPIDDEASQYENRRAFILMFKWSKALRTAHESLEPEKYLSHTAVHFWLAVAKYLVENRQFDDLTRILNFIESDRVKNSSKKFFEFYNKSINEETFNYEEIKSEIDKAVPVPNENRFREFLLKNDKLKSRETSQFKTASSLNDPTNDINILQRPSHWYSFTKFSIVAIGIALAIDKILSEPRV